MKLNLFWAAAFITTIYSMIGSAIAADDILNTAARNGSFNRLVSLVISADLDETLQGKGSFTVFAPTDEAFEALPKETLEDLLKPENQTRLAEILSYHVVGTEISIPKKRPSHPLKSAKTLNGERLKFTRKGSEVLINQSKVVVRNIECSNGLIHVIDAVLIPPKDDNSVVGVAAKAGSFQTLLAAAKAAGLAEALQGKGPFTVLAPTDEAFAKLPKQTLKDLLKPENKQKLAKILKYHVIPARVSAKEAVKASTAATLAGDKVAIEIKDGRLTINNSKVLNNDIEAENGLIHVIDSVLIPPTKNEKHSSTSNNVKIISIVANQNNSIKRDGIVADQVNVSCTGGSQATLTNIKAKRIVTRVSGGGTVSLSGDVENHEVTVNGGGVLRAKSLVTKATDIRVNGGGDAIVNATDLLSAAANSGAILKYVKTAAKIKKNINKYATFEQVSNHH